MAAKGGEQGVRRHRQTDGWMDGGEVGAKRSWMSVQAPCGGLAQADLQVFALDGLRTDAYADAPTRRFACYASGPLACRTCPPSARLQHLRAQPLTHRQSPKPSPHLC